MRERARAELSEGSNMNEDLAWRARLSGAECAQINSGRTCVFAIVWVCVCVRVYAQLHPSIREKPLERTIRIIVWAHS